MVTETPHYRGIDEDKQKHKQNKDKNMSVSIVTNLLVLKFRSCMCTRVHTNRGSQEVCDDGSVPGDGKGAGGLDSKFFAHLKRNWFWTSHLLACKTVRCKDLALALTTASCNIVSQNWDLLSQIVKI